MIEISYGCPLLVDEAYILFNALERIKGFIFDEFRVDDRSKIEYIIIIAYIPIRVYVKYNQEGFLLWLFNKLQTKTSIIL